MARPAIATPTPMPASAPVESPPSFEWFVVAVGVGIVGFDLAGPKEVSEPVNNGADFGVNWSKSADCQWIQMAQFISTIGVETARSVLSSFSATVVG